MKCFSTRLALVLVLCLCFFASGCASFLSPGDPPARLNFAPEFTATVPGTARTRAMQVVVSRPSLPTELSGDSIILLINQREMRRLAGYRWASSVPDILERAIVAAFNQSGAFAAVASSTSGITSRFHLLADVDQFAMRVPQTSENRPAGPSTAIIRGTFRLVNHTEGKTLATLPVSVEQGATASDSNAMAEAMEKATVRMMEEVVPWAVGVLSR